MSVTRETTLWCDAPECVAWVQIAAPRRADARQEARVHHGWRYQQGLDLCPVHA